MAASGVFLLSKAAQMMISKNQQQELLEEVCARNNTHPVPIFTPTMSFSPHLTSLSPSLSLPTVHHAPIPSNPHHAPLKRPTNPRNAKRPPKFQIIQTKSTDDAPHICEHLPYRP